MWFPQPMQSRLFPSLTFQVVWCWAFCLQSCPYPRYHHWSGDFAGGYGGPAVCTIKCSDVFAAIACVAFNFGGTITAFPSLVSEFFGLKNLAKNYGVIYLGFGIGSIFGSIIASPVGGFYVTFYVIFALLILSLALSTTIRQPEQKCCVRRMAPFMLSRELLGFSFRVHQTHQRSYKQ